MPIYKIEQDGRVYTVEAESQEGAYQLLDQEVGPVTSEPTTPSNSNGFGLKEGLMAGGALAAALALRNPKQAFNTLQWARHLGALSGAAVPKSTLGNISAPFIAAAERKSLEPIKQFFSRQTVKDWKREMWDPEAGMAWAEKTGLDAAEPALRWNPFGRLMSAGDVATRKALTRAGASDSEAVRYTLQTNLEELGLHGDVLKALESPAAKFAVLYRRTPMNAIVHGANNITDRPGLSAIAGAAGVAQASDTGAMGDPLSIALTSPMAGVYSLPYLLGAAVTKGLTRGKPGEAMQVSRGISPVPEDLASSFINPIKPIDKPAVVSLIERLSRLARTGKSY